MKFFILLFTLASAPAFACPNISGCFLNEVDGGGVSWWEGHEIKQQGCEIVTISSVGMSRKWRTTVYFTDGVEREVNKQRVRAYYEGNKLVIEGRSKTYYSIETDKIAAGWLREDFTGTDNRPYSFRFEPHKH